MAGTVEGAKKASAKILEKYGKDFYKRIGAKGGANSNTGGFYTDRKLASEAGRKGGKVSKRGNCKTYQLWATLTDGKVTLVGVVTGKGKAERERAELLKLETISDIKLLEA